MVNITIDGKQVSVPKTMTIMEAAERIGIVIPKLCFLKDINEIGACRVCVVEIEGRSKLISSCNHKVAEGMVIYTNSPKVRRVRRTNVELIMSQHSGHCISCNRSGNCSLQTLANDIGITEPVYPVDCEKKEWPMDYPLIRDSEKCIKCMRCIQICGKVQQLHVWDVSNTGYRTTVWVKDNQDIKDASCSLCGQCVTHCPVGALSIQDQTREVYQALEDPDKITVVQVAPAVRTAWAENLGISKEEATVGRMTAAIKNLGFDYVFDTDFSADLTIMEEGSEFLSRLPQIKESGLPMFTSCCPGWVRFIKSQYPEYVECLSSAKSPQQMFGAITKTYFAEKFQIDPKKLYVVSIMPCSAKKYECSVEEVNDANAGADVDVVLTTRELVKMLKADHISALDLGEEEFDLPLGVGSGAGAIFGASGGVMEAALRSVYYLVMGKNPDPDDFQVVRGKHGRTEFNLEVNGTWVKGAVVSGLGYARELMEDIKNGKSTYDFVEIMACPGGCSGGGGQPIKDNHELAAERGQILYTIDQKANLRFSHENPEVQALYADYLEKPNSHKAHELLHTDQKSWKL